MPYGNDNTSVAAERHNPPVWDKKTQAEHGGQTWQLCGENFVADFSVTTNSLGPPHAALEAAKESLVHSNHYPTASCEPALSRIAEFIGARSEQVLLGNGASEFIDLAMRLLPPGPWRPGPYMAQYMEYQRAATNAGRPKVSHADPNCEAVISVFVRPNAPTGHFMPRADVEKFLETDHCKALIIDESFLPFYGRDWKDESCVSLLDRYPGRLVIIHSWTKIWTCPGLRLGSVAASPSIIRRIKTAQAPWSCSTPAQAFAHAVVDDRAFLEYTWDTLPVWRRGIEAWCEELGWKVNKQSPAWVPWVTVDTGCDEVAEAVYDTGLRCGCPVRWCASFDMASYLRLGIHPPEAQFVLFMAVKNTLARLDLGRDNVP